MSFDPRMLAMLVAGHTEQAHDQLGAPKETPTTFRWATVTAADTTAATLRIQLDGDSNPLPFAPDTLVSGLSAGQRVWVQLFGKSVVILGLYDNPSSSATLAQAQSAVTGVTPIQTGGLGSYWRHSSGLQVCWYEGTQKVALDDSYGSLYLGTWKWTYPAKFSNTPSLYVGKFQWGTSASWGTGLDVQDTSATLRGFDAYNRASGDTDVSVGAIGFWK